MSSAATLLRIGGILFLLSRFLRLKPAQHGDIADELRDHLEARLEELSARGVSRDEAIRRALEEFGDAAVGDIGVGSAPMMGMMRGTSAQGNKGRGMSGEMPGLGGPPGAVPVGGGVGGHDGFGMAARETDSLADLIAMTIDPASWDNSGGHGSIIQYRGLLVVKNSQTVHGKIKVLLDMLRTTSSAGVPGAVSPATGGR